MDSMLDAVRVASNTWTSPDLFLLCGQNRDTILMQAIPEKEHSENRCKRMCPLNPTELEFPKFKLKAIGLLIPSRHSYYRISRFNQVAAKP